MTYQLRAGLGMLTTREPRKLLFRHFSLKAPLGGELPLPFTAYLVVSRIVALLRSRELALVIRLRLAGAQRFGDRHHDGSRSVEDGLPCRFFFLPLLRRAVIGLGLRNR